MLRLACFALLVAVASAGRINFGTCGSTGTVQWVDVQDCDASPCVLRKGHAYEIQTNFTPRGNSDSLVVRVVGKVSIITVPIVEKDACQGLPNGCPITGGANTDHSIVINISQELIETDATVELRLTNKEGAVEACITAPVRITS